MFSINRSLLLAAFVPLLFSLACAWSVIASDLTPVSRVSDQEAAKLVGGCYNQGPSLACPGSGQCTSYPAPLADPTGRRLTGPITCGTCDPVPLAIGALCSRS